MASTAFTVRCRNVLLPEVQKNEGHGERVPKLIIGGQAIVYRER